MMEELEKLESEGVARLPVKDLATLFGRGDTWRGPWLRLPPIQRSLVWSNEQIVDFWDSLLRGYPPGLMMVHKVRDAGDHKGVDENNRTVDVQPEDWQLFDGQQRMAAILLGFGEGALARNLRLWVDLDRDDRAGRMFRLIVSSMGQPFGYRADAPNAKNELATRRKAWSKWGNKEADATSGEVRARVFQDVKGCDLIATTQEGQDNNKSAIVPLADLLRARSGEKTVEQIVEQHACKGATPRRLGDFMKALDTALESRVIVTRVGEKVIEDPEDYVRFFGRIGQGGTRLTDDELTYSILKQRFPELREQMEGLMRADGRAGRGHAHGSGPCHPECPVRKRLA